jgi:hypothetical protein
MLLVLVYFVMRCLLQALGALRSCRLRTGGRAAGPSTSAQGDLAQRSPAAVPQKGPHAARRGEPDPVKRQVEVVRGDPWNSAPVAPRTRSPQADVSPRRGRAGQDSIPKRWSSWLGWRKRTPVGVPKDPRGAADARGQGLRHRGPDGPSARGPLPRSASERPFVEPVPPGSSPVDPGVRRLSRGDGVAAHLVRAVRDGARVQAGPRPRRHQEP